ncbi:arylsulfatase [Jejuia pallidilutea]|nr:arylsulfatase [Jejuia pallidilutea]
MILLIVGCQSNKKKETALVKKPNIIYILADDLGYGDLAFLGQEKIKTPNIDRLASESMLFTENYAGAPVCGPSRGSLMTGQHTGHAILRGHKSLEGIGVAPLNNTVVTLPEAIKKNTNYITAMCGRWHLGGELSDQTPFDRGFDYHFGKLSSDYPNKVGVMIDRLWDENGKHIPYEGYSKINTEPMYENGKLFNLSEEDMEMRPINMDEMVTEKAIRFINKDKTAPYFLYVAYSLVHEPMEYHEKYPGENTDWPEEERAFASMLQALDAYVGKIVAAVEASGEKDNTIIVFTSDNGAHNEGGHDVEFFNSNGKFKEYKRSFHEGGFHAPMIVRWPGVIKEGSVTNHIAAFWDVMPTFCEIAGASIPNQTDGISFLPTLKGLKQKEHEYLYWEFNEDIEMEKGHYKQAVRWNDWKGIYYINEDRFELYHLKNDIEENHDVAKENPEVVQKIKDIMKEAHKPSTLFPLLKSERINLDESL